MAEHYGDPMRPFGGNIIDFLLGMRRQIEEELERSRPRKGILKELNDKIFRALIEISHIDRGLTPDQFSVG